MIILFDPCPGLDLELDNCKALAQDKQDDQHLYFYLFMFVYLFIKNKIVKVICSCNFELL